MSPELLTTKSREVATAAVTSAAQVGHVTVEPAHLLLALLETDGSTATDLLRAVGARPEQLTERATQSLDGLPKAAGSTVAQPQLSRQLVNVFVAAEEIARPLGDEYVSTEHLLAALAQAGGDVAGWL
ncbi:MAG TPA: Clp protease N-terminal domain-containing protein, partial [Mycobacteriales bacterium]|nr:Clp protease N-terminal domain-containing protein [Mycobacteriales bacterium]